MARALKTRNEEKHRARDFLDNAIDALITAREALEGGRSPLR